MYTIEYYYSTFDSFEELSEYFSRKDLLHVINVQELPSGKFQVYYSKRR